MMNAKKMVVIGCVLMLASCSDTKKSLNLTKRAPDEFRVISNPPLHVPPNFDLSNPNKPAPTVHETSVAELTSTEKKFLKSLGSTEGSVREADVESNDKGVIRNFFSKMKGKSSDAVVDHVKEKERIEANKLQGKPINDGKVATKKVGPSTISKILGNAE